MPQDWTDRQIVLNRSQTKKVDANRQQTSSRVLIRVSDGLSRVRVPVSASDGPSPRSDLAHLIQEGRLQLGP
jgi:hypothetical protein